MADTKRKNSKAGLTSIFKFSLLQRGFLLLSLFFFCTAGSSHAVDVKLQWRANTEQDLAGYRVYQSAQSGAYNFAPGNEVADVPKGTETVTLNDIPAGISYWVVTAYDNEGFESSASNEVSNFAITSPQNGFYVNAANDDNYPAQGLTIVGTSDDIFVESSSVSIGGPFLVDESGAWSGPCDFSSLNQGNVGITATSNGMTSDDVTGIYDRTSPDSSASSASSASEYILVPWTASDQISGVGSTYLWHKPPGATQLTNTGYSRSGTSGTFYYTPTQGEGVYYFATRSVDYAGNWEAEPNGDGDMSINYIASINSDPTGKEGGGGGCFITTAAPD